MGSIYDSNQALLRCITYVVALGLVPVHWVNGTNSAVAWNSVGLAVGRVSTATTGETRLADGLVAGVASNLALEAVHVHLF